MDTTYYVVFDGWYLCKQNDVAGRPALWFGGRERDEVVAFATREDANRVYQLMQLLILEVDWPKLSVSADHSATATPLVLFAKNRSKA